MKIILLITLLMLSGESYGLNRDTGALPDAWNREPSYNDANSYSGGNSTDIEIGDSDSQSDSSITDSSQTITQIRATYEAAARAVTLNLAYCQDGGGVSDRRATLSIGGVNYACEVAIAIPQMLSGVAPLLKAAENYPVGSRERRVEKAKAQAILAKVSVILGEELPDYIQARSNTASIGSFFRDTWWIFAILLIAL